MNLSFGSIAINGRRIFSLISITWICSLVTIPKGCLRWQMPDRYLSATLFSGLKKSIVSFLLCQYHFPVNFHRKRKQNHGEAYHPPTHKEANTPPLSKWESEFVIISVLFLYLKQKMSHDFFCNVLAVFKLFVIYLASVIGSLYFLCLECLLPTFPPCPRPTLSVILLKYFLPQANAGAPHMCLLSEHCDSS